MRLSLTVRSICLLIVTGLTGCSDSPVPSEVSDALENADTFEVFSLNPDPDEGTHGPDGFHRWRIVGSVSIDDPGEQSQIAKALEESIEKSHGPAECFWPRHGLRLTQGDQIVELVICFQCSQIEWYSDSKRQATILTDSLAQQTLDEILIKHDVPLPDPYPPSDAKKSETTAPEPAE